MISLAAADMAQARRLRAILLRASADIAALGDTHTVWPTPGWDLESTLAALADLIPEVDTSRAWARFESAEADLVSAE